MANITPEEQELINKFQLLVDKKDNESCWEWLGEKDEHGQGIFKLGKNAIEAHTLSWLIFFGFLPEGKTVWHKCNFISCVNPHHLYLEDENVMAPYEPKPLPENFKDLMPGTYTWMEYWRAHPEQQEEMIRLERKRR